MEDNPAKMSNADLEKDMQDRMEQNHTSGNQEFVNKSTAAEGQLKSSTDDLSSAVDHHTGYNANDEQDLDDLVHRQADEGGQDGSLPSPEDIPEWEDDELDHNKISG